MKLLFSITGVLSLALPGSAIEPTDVTMFTLKDSAADTKGLRGRVEATKVELVAADNATTDGIINDSFEAVSSDPLKVLRGTHDRVTIGDIDSESAVATSREAEMVDSLSFKSRDLSVKWYLGCYNWDSNDKPLLWRGKNVDVDGCIDICCKHNKGPYKYVGLMYGKTCFCTNDENYGRHGLADVSTCNLPCDVNSGQICGGNGVLSVYDAMCPTNAPTVSPTNVPTSTPTKTPTDVPTTPPTTLPTSTPTKIPTAVPTTQPTTVPTIAPTTSMAPSGSGPRFTGCYKWGDNSDKPMLWRGKDVDIDGCVDICCKHRLGPYKYVGLMHGKTCYCTNDENYGRHGLADSSSCNKPCDVNKDQICGGSGFLSVYNTAVPNGCPAAPGSPTVSPTGPKSSTTIPTTPFVEATTIPTTPFVEATTIPTASFVEATTIPTASFVEATGSPTASVTQPKQASPAISEGKIPSKVITIPEPKKPENLDPVLYDCPHWSSGLMLWHDTKTWSDNKVPGEGQDVTIPAGGRVLINETVVEKLGIITVPKGSELILGQNIHGSIELKIHGMIVEGALIAGSPTCPLLKPLTVTLHGERPATATQLPTPVPAEYKGINCNGGTLSLHGKRFFKTWSRLGKTVEVGEKVLVLQDLVNWVPGQQVVVTTSVMEDSRARHENEVFLIDRVENNDPENPKVSVIFLQGSGAQYRHGANQYYQAEVGLLSRAIIIQGALDDSMPTDPDPLDGSCLHSKAGSNGNLYAGVRLPCADKELTGYGGHIVVQNGGIGMVEGVELVRMGQTNVLARYPMHFHLLGDCPSCYFRRSSVHRSFYRCAVIHGTNEVDLSENVAFDIVGNCYYLEDGVEENNTIAFNLGALIHSIGEIAQIHPSNSQYTKYYDESDNLRNPADAAAAAFYAPNKHNRFIGNAASGGWAGFSFVKFHTAIGDHRDLNRKPSNRPFIEFDGNTAHSTGFWYPSSSGIYFGGELGYDDDGELRYNGGRGAVNSPKYCNVDACQAAPKFDCDQCPNKVEIIPKTTNSKVWLVLGPGLNSWNGQMEIINYEAYDCGLSFQAITTGMWVHNLNAVCRTGEKLGVKANKIQGTGFRWYSTGQSHILTNCRWENCGYREERSTRYGGSPTRGCDSNPDTGCDKDSAVFRFLTHANNWAPEIMQGTRDQYFANNGKRFGFSRSDPDKYAKHEMETVAGRGQNWFDADGSASGLGEPTIIASGLNSSRSWWGVDDEVIFTSYYEGPVSFIKRNNGPHRAVGFVEFFYDQKGIQKNVHSVCNNGMDCPVQGYLRHLGRMFSPTYSGAGLGMPLTPNGKITGPIGGFGWVLKMNKGAPVSLKLSRPEIDNANPFLLSVPYPPGTKVTVTVHTKQSYKCKKFTDDYKCQIQFDKVDSIAEVRHGAGKYYQDDDGVVTVRFYQPPDKDYVGNPDVVIPTFDTPGLVAGTKALNPFIRADIVLPEMANAGVYFEIVADCPTSDGVYCDGDVVDYDPDVCDEGYVQVAYDKCCKKDGSNLVDGTDCKFPDGTTAPINKIQSETTF